MEWLRLRISGTWVFCSGKNGRYMNYVSMGFIVVNVLFVWVYVSNAKRRRKGRKPVSKNIVIVLAILWLVGLLAYVVNVIGKI
jgi:uncharacterized MAPEG superfamily protein